MPVTYCPKCCFHADKLISVISHIAQAHLFDSVFYIVCGVNGCQKNYTSFEPYRRHLYWCHEDTLKESGSNVGQQSTNIIGDTTGIYVDSTSMECEADHSEQDQTPEEEPLVTYDQFVRDTRRALCKFYFKASEKHDLPHSVASSIFSDIRFLFQDVIHTFAKQISQALIGAAKTEAVEELLTCSFISDIFTGLETHHQRVQYATNVFPYVEPEEHQLSDQKASFQYIRIGT